MTQLVKSNELDQYIGKQADPSPWFVVTQNQINQFAECTQDQQFIHVDTEAAKKGPFGTTIAHGFLTLSMLSHFSESYSLQIEGVHTLVNYGFDKVRFLSPVKVNSRIRANALFVGIEEKSPGQFLLRTQVTVEIEGEDKPALIAEWIAMQIS